MQRDMMVVIPIAIYKAMITKCDASRPEYAVLQDGLVARNRQGRQQVEIICGSEQAKQLVRFAATDFPEVPPLARFVSPAPRAV